MVGLHGEQGSTPTLEYDTLSFPRVFLPMYNSYSYNTDSYSYFHDSTPISTISNLHNAEL